MTVEARLQAIEDRLALQEVVNAYCTAVDKLSDIEGLVGLFTADAVFDLSAIHLPRVEGHAGIRGFFQPVFETMTHHAHYWSNFRIDRLEQNMRRSAPTWSAWDVPGMATLSLCTCTIFWTASVPQAAGRSSATGSSPACHCRA